MRVVPSDFVQSIGESFSDFAGTFTGWTGSLLLTMTNLLNSGFSFSGTESWISSTGGVAGPLAPVNTPIPISPGSTLNNSAFNLDSANSGAGILGGQNASVDLQMTMIAPDGSETVETVYAGSAVSEYGTSTNSMSSEDINEAFNPNRILEPRALLGCRTCKPC